MEIFQSQLVEQHIAGQQLLAANVHGVLRQVERIAQRDAAGGELDARSKRFFRAGREHHRPLPADLQLQPAEKTGVVVKQPDIGRTRRRDVPGDGGRQESLAVNQSEIVDFTRLERLRDLAYLLVRRCHLHQRLGNLAQGFRSCAHATDLSPALALADKSTPTITCWYNST